MGVARVAWPTLLVGVMSIAIAVTGTPVTVRAETDSAADPGDARPAGSTTAPVDSPEIPVVTLQDALLASMKRGDGEGFEARRSALAGVIDETFDLEFMARTAVGRSWKDLDPAARARWVETFTRYTTTNFADRFDHYSGQEFVLSGERSAPRDTRVVMTTIERRDKEPVRLDFRVMRTPAGWRIIDVYGKGTVSELALRRAEYAPILKDEGIDGLIRAVDEHTDRIARSSQS